MKISTLLPAKSLNRIAAVFLLAAASIVLHSCAKDTTSTTAISGLTVVNASPTAATYNVYLNSSKVSTAALPFTGTIPYFQILPGTDSLKFTSASSAESLLTKIVSLEANKAYSLFLIDKPGKLDGLLVTDDLSANNTTKALVRFVNLSPDAGTLALTETAGTTLGSDQSYKGYSTFAPIDGKTYSLQIKDKVTGNVLSTLDNVILTAGKMYTVVAAGMLTPAVNDQALRIQVITNK